MPGARQAERDGYFPSPADLAQELPPARSSAARVNNGSSFAETVSIARLAAAQGGPGPTSAALAGPGGATIPTLWSKSAEVEPEISSSL